MDRRSARGRSSMLDWLAGIYLHSRYFLGLGLIALTALVIVIGVGGSNTWVVGVAGSAIIAHAFASRFMESDDATVALVVDLTAVMAAAMVFGNANSSPTPVLLTFVGASVMIALFTNRLTRLAILIWVAGFSFMSLLIVWEWDLKAALGGYIGSVFLASFVIGVVAAIRNRIVELEATKAQTIGVIGHELRNHLAGVIAAIQLVRTQELEPEELAEILELAHDQAAEAADVIDDLVTASRVESGSLESLTEDIDLRRITETAIRRTSLDAGEILYSSPHAPVWAVADEIRYGQILRNLLTNALRYGGDEIRVSIEQLQDTVSVVVADNGEGVHPEDVSSLFHPYTTGANAEAVPDSNGLGLWIALGLAQSMGGNLTYRRNSGQTIFELTLPAGHDPGPETLEDRLPRHSMSG
jgi:signal transduction histidine kinase